MKELDVLCKRKEYEDKKTDTQLAQIVCKIHNVNCSKKNDMKNIEDFMLTHIPKKITSVEGMKNAAKLLTKAYGGVIK